MSDLKSFVLKEVTLYQVVSLNFSCFYEQRYSAEASAQRHSGRIITTLAGISEEGIHYARVFPTPPTLEEKELQAKIQAKKDAYAKALDLGMTHTELNLLRD